MSASGVEPCSTRFTRTRPDQGHKLDIVNEGELITGGAMKTHE